MGAINQQWHDTHHMPANPTPLERLSWHEAHQKECGCGPMPDSVKRMAPPNGSADQV